MKQFIVTLLVLILFSCNKNEKKSDFKISTESNNDSLKIQTENNEVKKPDTLKIKYLEHKNLLDILTILPDSSMDSWRWDKIDRVEFVEKIKINNYTTGSDFFSNISLTQPNTIHIQVVDGSWILSIYKVKPNDYIVITDDMVGGGNYFICFEYINGELKYIPTENVFENFLTALVIDKNDEKCMAFFEDNKIGFEYNFIGTKKIKIYNSMLEESKSCFKGNTLNYEFNPEIKKFSLINIE